MTALKKWTPTTKYVLAAWEAWMEDEEGDDPNNKEAPDQFNRWLKSIKAEAWNEGYQDGFGDGGVNAWDPANPYGG